MFVSTLRMWVQSSLSFGFVSPTAIGLGLTPNTNPLSCYKTSTVFTCYPLPISVCCLGVGQVAYFRLVRTITLKNGGFSKQKILKFGFKSEIILSVNRQRRYWIWPKYLADQRSIISFSCNCYLVKLDKKTCQLVGFAYSNFLQFLSNDWEKKEEIL